MRLQGLGGIASPPPTQFRRDTREGSAYHSIPPEGRLSLPFYPSQPTDPGAGLASHAYGPGSFYGRFSVQGALCVPALDMQVGFFPSSTGLFWCSYGALLVQLWGSLCRPERSKVSVGLFRGIIGLFSRLCRALLADLSLPLRGLPRKELLLFLRPPRPDTRQMLPRQCGANASSWVRAMRREREPQSGGHELECQREGGRRYGGKVKGEGDVARRIKDAGCRAQDVVCRVQK